MVSIGKMSYTISTGVKFGLFHPYLFILDNLKLHSTEGFPLLHQLLRIESYRTMIWAWSCTFSDYHCQFPKEPLAATRLMLATFTNHSVFPISLSVLILFWSASKINWTRFSYLYQLSDVCFVHISIYVFLCSATLFEFPTDYMVFDATRF